MKISIITVTYNSEKTIADTIQSVLKQTYKDFEHIIVDGLSKDNTMQIVKENEGRYNGKLKYISEKDKGIYDAMNKGVSMATGDIIGILNSDDIYSDNNVLEKIHKKFVIDKELDGIFGNLLFLDNETMTKVQRVWKSKTGHTSLGWHPAHPTLYLKKEVYEKIGKFNLQYRIAADYDFMLRMLKNKNIKLEYINEYLIYMRHGGASTEGLNGYIKNFKESYIVLKNNSMPVPFFINSIRTLKTIIQMIVSKFAKSKNIKVCIKKITFLMLHLNYGGLEKQTITLINELAKTNKFEIEIISVYKIIDKPFYDLNSNVKIKYLLNYGPNKIELLQSLKGKNIFKILKETIKSIKTIFLKNHLMKQEIKRLNTDIIFSTRIEFAKKIKRKDTLNISQEHSYDMSSKYIKKITNSFNFIDDIVVMTGRAKTEYEKILKNTNYKGKVIRIPNMITTMKSDNLENKKLNKYNIIAIGRLEQVKDYKTMIDVMSECVVKDENIKLTIIGEGIQRNELKVYVTKKQLQNHIIFVGRKTANEIVEYLDKSNILLCTSMTESFSLVICEAMAQGVVPVSFNVEVGPREIITDGTDGFLINNRNINEMAEKIVEIVENESLNIEISKNALEKSKQYSASNIVNDWLGILG